MCTSSYKPPKAQPVPPPPPAPTEGAQAPVINDGNPGGAVAKLALLAQSANSLVVPYVGAKPGAMADMRGGYRRFNAELTNYGGYSGPATATPTYTAPTPGKHQVR